MRLEGVVASEIIIRETKNNKLVTNVLINIKHTDIDEVVPVTFWNGLAVKLDKDFSEGDNISLDFCLRRNKASNNIVELVAEQIV